MTSHDAVAFVRRVLKTKRVGHTGTLDPAAAGVLPICVGMATRLVENLQAGEKEYLAEATFGFETDSGDITGEIVRECDASELTLERLNSVLDRFCGEIEQTPPLHSAVKVGGKRLYELARAGQEIEIPTRRVVISRLLATQFEAGARPRAMLHIECGSGTYIRSLVRDVGRELGLAATMTFLVRTRSGLFALNEAVSAESFAVEPRLYSLDQILGECAEFVLTDEQAAHDLGQGKNVQLSRHSESFSSNFRGENSFVVKNEAATLFVLAQQEANGWARPLKVFDLRSTHSN